MGSSQSATQVLARLLRDYLDCASAEHRAAAAERVRERYLGRRTILIGDMSGFTRRVASEGIVHYLSLIFDMRRVCLPVIEASGGYLFKVDADNLFAAFHEPRQALDAALAIQRTVEQVNARRPEVDRIDLGLGLACGEVLAIGQEDAWGEAVNAACKLGEDLAHAGQILAHESLGPWLEQSGLPLRPATADASGVQLRYYEVGWRANV